MILVMELTASNKQLSEVAGRLDKYIDENIMCSIEEFDAICRRCREEVSSNIELSADDPYIYAVVNEENAQLVEQLKRERVLDDYWLLSENHTVIELEGYIIEQNCVAVKALVDKYKHLLEIKQNSDSSEAVVELQGKIDELEKELQSVRSVNNQLSTDRDSEGSRIETLNAEIERLQNTIQELTQKLDDNVKNYSSSMVSLESSYKDKMEQLKIQLQEETEKCSKVVADWSAKVRERESDLELTKEELSQAQTRVEVLEAKNASLESSLGENRADMQELANLQGRLSELEMEKQEALDKIEHLETEREVLQSDIENLSTQNQIMKVQSEGTAKKADSLDAKLKAAQAEIASLKDAKNTLATKLEEVSFTDAEDETKGHSYDTVELGLSDYRGTSTVIIGVAGYGSSVACSNIAASIANSLGTMDQVAVIDLDESYVGMNLFYAVSRKTSRVDDGKMDNYVHRMSLGVPQYLAGFHCVKSNKSGEVYYGGGNLGGMFMLPEGALVRELNGLASSVSFIVLNLGCITPTKLNALYEIYARGRLVMVSSSNANLLTLLGMQLRNANIDANEVNWVVSTPEKEPITDRGREFLKGKNYIELDATSLSGTTTVDIGRFNMTFRNFVNTVVQ